MNVLGHGVMAMWVMVVVVVIFISKVVGLHGGISTINSGGGDDDHGVEQGRRGLLK